MSKEEEELLEKKDSTDISKPPGTKYCVRCQKYVEPKKRKLGVGFVCFAIIFTIVFFIFFGIIGIIVSFALLLAPALSNPTRCSVCKKKLGGDSPPSNIQTIIP